MTRREREPGEWRTLGAMWAVRDATAPAPRIEASLTSEQGRVLGALLLFVDADGKAHPGMARVAKLAGMHPQRVRRVLAGLERDAGPLTLTVDRSRRNRRGEQDTHGYQFAFTADRASSLEKTAGDVQVDARQQSREDGCTRLEKTAPPVSGRRVHPSREDDKADLGADSSEDSSGSAAAAAGKGDASTTVSATARPHATHIDVTEAFSSPADEADDEEHDVSAARADHNRRMQLKRDGDASWWADPQPSWLAMLYLSRVKMVFGADELETAEGEVTRAWSAVVSASAGLLDQLKGYEWLALDFIDWFFGKEAKRKHKPGHTRPGWRLVLNHPPLLDEYRNVLRAKKRQPKRPKSGAA